MIEKVKHNFKRIREVLPNIVRYLKTTSNNHQVQEEGLYALINLDNKIMNQSGGRFSYLLCKYFEQSGYRVILKTNLSFFLVLHPYKRLLLNRKYAFVSRIGVPENSIISAGNGRTKQFLLQTGLQSLKADATEYSLPFPMHPVQVDNFDRRLLERLRNKKRKIRIFFSGSWTQIQYKQPLHEYNVLTRFEVINHLNEKFAANGLLKQVSEGKDLYKLLNGGSFKEPIVISEIKTKDEDWLDFLATSDFFIAPPGFRYPWCHNAIEAMAVGAIPILQYNNLFVPHLQHLENCLSYNSKQELEKVVEFALSLGQEEIARLKQNVIAYYDNHLSPEAIVNRIQNLSGSEKKEIHLSLPYIN